jgi:hypothetical protein
MVLRLHSNCSPHSVGNVVGFADSFAVAGGAAVVVAGDAAVAASAAVADVAAVVAVAVAAVAAAVVAVAAASSWGRTLYLRIRFCLRRRHRLRCLVASCSLDCLIVP